MEYTHVKAHDDFPDSQHGNQVKATFAPSFWSKTFGNAQKLERERRKMHEINEA